MGKKRNYARFYCLLGEVMPLMDKEGAKEMVADLSSNGRTGSLRELTDEEFEEALRYLTSQLKGANAEVKKARSQALHQLQKYGVDTTSWDAVNAFTLQPRIAGKAFYYLDKAELEALTRKMRSINAKKQKSKEENAKAEEPKSEAVPRRTYLLSMRKESAKILLDRKTTILN